MFSNRPHHVRRKIALVWTVIIAGILFAVLIFVHTRPKGEQEQDESPSKLKQFYQSLSQNAGSLFSEN